jgi:hypothetical protein
MKAIHLLRKPLISPLYQNVMDMHTWGLNIDQTRVKASAEDFLKMSLGVEKIRSKGGVLPSWKNSSDLSWANPANPHGRWPANVLYYAGHSFEHLFHAKPLVGSDGSSLRYFQPFLEDAS